MILIALPGVTLLSTFVTRHIGSIVSVRHNLHRRQCRYGYATSLRALPLVPLYVCFGRFQHCCSLLLDGPRRVPRVVSESLRFQSRFLCVLIAEGEGFEPPERFTARLVSSEVPSTTRPSFRFASAYLPRRAEASQKHVYVDKFGTAFYRCSTPSSCPVFQCSMVRTANHSRQSHAPGTPPRFSPVPPLRHAA